MEVGPPLLCSGKRELCYSIMLLGTCYYAPIMLRLCRIQNRIQMEFPYKFTYIIIGTGFLYGCERHRPNSISGSPIYFLVKNPSPTHSCVPVNCIEIHSVCQCHRPNSVSGSLIYLPVKNWYLFLFEFDTTSRCRRCIRISTAVRIGMTMYV